MWNRIEYCAEYLDEMLQMTVENYGENEHIANKSFVEHEYFNNPSGEPTISLAYDLENKRLAGQYVVIAQRMHVCGNEYLSILSLNTLTRKEYRGQKVFISLAEEVYKKNIDKGIYFCYGAPNQNSHHGFVAKLGFEDIGIMPLYLKIINPLRLVVEKLGLVKRVISNVEKKGFNTDENIVDINAENIALIDEFWKEIKTKYPVMVVRDAEFVKWRYLDMPLRNYKIYGYVEDEKLKGYIITRVTEVAHMQCGMIVDFLFESGCNDIGSKLISHAQRVFKKNKVSLMGCLMQSHFEEVSVLKKKMFFKCPKFLEPQPFPIIFRKLNSNSDDKTVENFKNWFFTMGDYDVI